LLLPKNTSRTPQLVVWIVVGVCLLALIPFLLPSRNAAKPLLPDKNVAQEKPEPAGPPEVAQAEPNKPEQPAPPPLPGTPEGRLEELGKLVIAQAKIDGHFPSGTVAAEGLTANQRWSWLAQLASKQDNPTNAAVAWNLKWNDPGQDRFVRRSI